MCEIKSLILPKKIFWFLKKSLFIDLSLPLLVGFEPLNREYKLRGKASTVDLQIKLAVLQKVNST